MKRRAFLASPLAILPTGVAAMGDFYGTYHDIPTISGIPCGHCHHVTFWMGCDPKPAVCRKCDQPFE
jgi:hypothetical protein